ncbi:MAG TPA: VanW family protein [Thermoleophilia bacterium]
MDPRVTSALEPLMPAARRGRLRRLGAWYRRHAWSTTAVLVLLVLIAGFGALQAAMRGRIGDGVSVAGLPLQGQTTAAARGALERDLAPRTSLVRLQTGKKEPLTLTLAQLGISLDAGATAAAAQARGRHRLPLVGFEVWLPGGGGEVAPVIRVDAAAYQKGLEAVRSVVDIPARDATLDLGGSRVKVVPARDGSQVDAVAFERAIAGALARGKAYDGPVPMVAVPPQVSTADAQSRAGVAATYLARPITLRYRGRTVVLSPHQMAGMLSVDTGSTASVYPLTFRNSRARAVLHKLFAWAERKPVDARIIVHPKGGITVTESKDGEVLDMKVLLEDLDYAAVGGGLRTIFVAISPALPALSTEEARSMGFASLGSQFTTYFDARNTPRVTNIALAAKLVDGSVVQPGATFSLNAAMGPRTANRGFDYAPVIAADNVLRQGVGGGICQYATTLFNAVFFAGLPVVERQAHSLYISHYPIGRDATVAWGAIDFKFKNDTGKALMIRSWVEADSLTVAIVGKTGRKVTYATGAFYDIRKPVHGKANPRVIYDSDLGPGMIRWERGIDGRSVRVERTVRDANGKVLFRDTFVSHYDPLDWVKRVGT